MRLAAAERLEPLWLRTKSPLVLGGLGVEEGEGTVAKIGTGESQIEHIA